MKVSELTGAKLDYWIAKADGQQILAKHYELTGIMGEVSDGVVSVRYSPSTDWSQAGQIIEREKISIEALGNEWRAQSYSDTEKMIPEHYEYGPTPLIAAMRCFVASKFGENLED